MRQPDHLLDRLRYLAPSGSLTTEAAYDLAERQASLLLRLSGIRRPYVPGAIIASRPEVDLWFRPEWPASGASVHVDGRWHLVVRSSEPPQRQRFTLFHEFKHVLDHDRAEQLYGHLDATTRHDAVEQVCDYFAACVLMPCAWLTRDWARGMRQVRYLATRYEVSETAMRTRLEHLGLMHPAVSSTPDRTLQGSTAV